MLYLNELTFEFAPFAADKVQGVSVSCDNVLAGIACSSAKDDNLGL